MYIHNSVSLAGEFAVLSQLMLCGSSLNAILARDNSRMVYSICDTH